MTTYTLNKNNPDVLNISGKPAIQAATAGGKSLLLAILAFAKEESTEGTNLKYVKESKAWLDNTRNVVLFNVATSDSTSKQAIDLVKDFSKNTGYQAPAKTQINTGGVLATDSGEPIAVSTPVLENSTGDAEDNSAVNSELVQLDHELNDPKNPDCEDA